MFRSKWWETDILIVVWLKLHQQHLGSGMSVVILHQNYVGFRSWVWRSDGSNCSLQQAHSSFMCCKCLGSKDFKGSGAVSTLNFFSPSPSGWLLQILMWCLWLHLQQWYLEVHTDILWGLKQLKHNFSHLIVSTHHKSVRSVLPCRIHINVKSIFCLINPLVVIVTNDAVGEAGCWLVSVFVLWMPSSNMSLVQQYYYRNTNHQEEGALWQLLLKLNWLEESIDKTSEWKKQVHWCKIYN